MCDELDNVVVDEERPHRTPDEMAETAPSRRALDVVVNKAPDKVVEKAPPQRALDVMVNGTPLPWTPDEMVEQAPLHRALDVMVNGASPGGKVNRVFAAILDGESIEESLCKLSGTVCSLTSAEERVAIETSIQVLFLRDKTRDVTL